ncbi:MAG: 3-deoxy-D-manno-octulosonic acid transferase [Pirellulales bacterium]
MRYLLNLIYLAVLLLAAPWLAAQAVRKGKYRQGWLQKFFGLVPRRAGERPCLWLHAVSVGEVNLLATLLRRLQAALPGWDFVVSTTTMTGYALAKTRYPDVPVCYCPLDFSWSVAAAVRRIRPDVLVLAELELWPNLIGACRAAGARVAVVNGRLSDRSFRGYRLLRPILGRLLRQIDLIAAQNDQYAGRFRALGAAEQSLCVTGSLKYDGAQTERANPRTQRLARLAGFAPGDTVFLAGSTGEPEEALALAAFSQLAAKAPRLRLVIVPRHPDRFDAVAELLESSGHPWQRRSALDHTPATPNARILLVDQVGELGAWWGTAQIGFVGGSLCGRGGQNMIEPAAYGVAVSFGPNTRNFRDIVAGLLAAEGAVVVEDGQSLAQFVERCLQDLAYAEQLGRRAAAHVASQLGATERTVGRLLALTGEGASDTSSAAIRAAA